jgi:nitrate/TMAO reductase-like tetraheme cytochrome c subunit
VSGGDDRPRSFRFPRGTPGRTLLLAAGLAAGLALVAMGTAMEVSSQPKFCGSCHIMRPYYDSWTESSHRNIACVDCHIPPGITAELRKKYEAVSMVARYFTGTYGTNPWAEIDDASCLSCHQRRLLSGRELFGDVLFDHAAHLAGMRRGKTLRCTSCHSQIVQGSHIAVTPSTCILCHFKDQEPASRLSRCTLCHSVPDTVFRTESLTFDHGDVARLGMECRSCHARPEGSDGAVPRERCLTCHNQASRLEHYDDGDLLHRHHVTEHKVDCTNCHLEIEHVAPPIIEAATTSCDACHQAGHTPQHLLYSGRGGRHVEPMPDPMFLAGVRCEGCHISLPGVDAATHTASEVSCMSCHGPSYRSIYRQWREGVAARVGGLKRQIETTEAALGGARPAAIEDARFNLDLVERARGVHNVGYAYALLRRSHADLNAARGTRGMQPLAEPWTDAPYRSACLDCHGGIEEQRGSIFGRRFFHRPHVVGAAIECAACHRSHDERARKEIVRFDAAGCTSCHHREAASRCASCHPSAGPAGPVKTSRGDFDHAFHVEGLELDCSDCHAAREDGGLQLLDLTCTGCHE